MGCGGTKYTKEQPKMDFVSEPVESSGTGVHPIRKPNPKLQDEDKSPPQMKAPEIDIATLQKYVELEKEIQILEKRQVLDSYQIKAEQLEQLEEKLKELRESKAEQEEIANRLQAVIDTSGNKQSLKQFLLTKNTQSEPLTTEEEEYVDILNRLEVLSREVQSTEMQRNQLKNELSSLTAEGKNMQDLYTRRDDLLDSIFGGAYGSSQENKLEKEIDLLLERKKHVEQANFKWKHAQMMVKQACYQLGLAVQKWKELAEVTESNVEQRYCCAAEARNNLVAASQNLQGAHRFLQNITFPYCSPEETDTLNKAITFIFTDMQTTERHGHALDCYRTTYKRCGALKQWFDQVLNTTISKDLAELTEETKKKTQELRQERIRLIRTKVGQITGKDLDLDYGSLDADAEDLAADEQVAQLFEAERVEGKQGTLHAIDPNFQLAPTPVPVSDLAPMPSNEEIFGKIDELRKKHAAEMADFEKAQTVNRARTKQGLQEKLEIRRSRRSRLQAHESELQDRNHNTD